MPSREEIEQNKTRKNEITTKTVAVATTTTEYGHTYKYKLNDKQIKELNAKDKNEAKNKQKSTKTTNSLKVQHER